jgi:hypothetical protein
MTYEDVTPIPPILGYYQLVVKKEVNGKRIDKSRKEIIDGTLRFVPEIKKAFSG